jgi:hypothetical protein
MLPELEAAQLESGDGTAFVAETEMKAGATGMAATATDNEPDQTEFVDTEPSLNETTLNAATDMHTTDNEDRREKRIHNYRGSKVPATATSGSISFGCVLLPSLDGESVEPDHPARFSAHLVTRLWTTSI